MNKLIKWTMWVLIVIGVVFTVLVFAMNGSDLSVNLLLYWAYVMLGFAICAILYGIVRDCMVNPKNLKKIGIVVGGALVIVALAYILAPGSPAIGYNGVPVSEGTLKLTDTVLNLTYFSVVVAVLAIVANAIMDASKK